MRKQKYKFHAIVFYVASDKRGQITGMIDIMTNRCFINKLLSLDIIKEKTPDIKNIVITNIIPLTKRQYKRWTEKI